MLSALSLMGKITRSEWRETLPNSAVVLRVRPMPGDTLIAGIRGEMHCGPGYCAVRVGGQNRRREIRRTPISALELLCLPYSVQWAHSSQSLRATTAKLSPKPNQDTRGRTSATLAI